MAREVRNMDFSIMFWGNVPEGERRGDDYRLLLDTAVYADEHGFAAVWIPERHFHPWGGLFPNPSVLAAAVAARTKRVRIRAGSVVIPLHHPIRIAEEWSVVDNLSGGRVEISIATGWRADDFILAPDAYANRKDGIWESLETIQRLWRGEKVSGRNGLGETIEAGIWPRPIQAELPIWITSAGGLRTITDAGESGYGLLTHLLGQDFSDLEKKIVQYRAYRARAGLAGNGRVALMLHTFLGADKATVKEQVRSAMSTFLLQSADLAIPASQRPEWDSADDKVKAELVSVAFDRYFETASLMGTPESCRGVVEKCRALGVTDICCLVDFGLPTDQVLEGLSHLNALKGLFATT